MDTRTGKIYVSESQEEMNKLLEEYADLKQIDIEDLTDKQKNKMQVSKYDNRSKLGKIFTGNRKERRRQERLYRRQNR